VLAMQLETVCIDAAKNVMHSSINRSVSSLNIGSSMIYDKKSYLFKVLDLLPAIISSNNDLKVLMFKAYSLSLEVM
jgi:hypothetical protein